MTATFPCRRNHIDDRPEPPTLDADVDMCSAQALPSPAFPARRRPARSRDRGWLAVTARATADPGFPDRSVDVRVNLTRAGNNRTRAFERVFGRTQQNVRILAAPDGCGNSAEACGRRDEFRLHARADTPSQRVDVRRDVGDLRDRQSRGRCVGVAARASATSSRIGRSAS